MAFNDSWNGRRGMLGWRDGRTLPVADLSLANSVDSQLVLRLPGQHDIEAPNPPLETVGYGMRAHKHGIGIGF